MTRRVVAVATTWLATLAGAAGLFAAGQASGSGLLGGFSLVFFGLAIDVVAFASVGAILVLRRPGNRVGVALIGAAPLIVVTFLGFVVGAARTTSHGPVDGLGQVASVVGGLGLFPTLILIGPVLALLFPDGRLPGRRWRQLVSGLGAGLFVGLVLSMLRPGPVNVGLADNPFGVEGTAWVEAASGIGAGLAALMLPASLALAVAGVVARFRRSRGAERRQLKWFVAAVVVVAVFLSVSIADGAGEPTAFDFLAVCSLSLPPVAVGVAITRYRLYEIDRLISRGAAWTVLTGLLVAVYAGGVLVLQGILGSVTQGETLAVAASTLLAAALFQPLRLRVQRAMDRRFDRARYDGERTAAAFAERLRGQVDLAGLETDLTRTVDSVLRPSATAVWLRTPAGGRS